MWMWRKDEACLKSKQTQGMEERTAGKVHAWAFFPKGTKRCEQSSLAWWSTGWK